MKCPNCATQNPDGARFCYHCGSELALKCSNCGTTLPADARYCFNCGHRVSEESKADHKQEAESQISEVGDQSASQEKKGSSTINLKATATGSLSPLTSHLPSTTSLAPQSGLPSLQSYMPKELVDKLETARKAGLMEGERRIVTILFCDVTGSTSAASGLDPEEWTEIMNGAFEYMIEPVYRYEGTVARLLGDGLLAFFGAPIAHEDDPQRAILAGMGITKGIRRYAARIKERWNLDFDVRVGINTGLVVVGAVGSDLRMEYSALGDAINLAARMEQSAVPGTVLVAEVTYKLAAPLFDFETLGEIEVKGKEQLVQAYRVVGQKSEPGSLRGLAGLHSPLVGRQAQLEIMRQAVAELKKGSGQILSVMGEAGLGKSRLVAELRQEIEAGGSSAVRWLEGRSLSYETKKPFTLFMSLFEDFFGLDPGAGEVVKVESIKEQIDQLIPGQGPLIMPFIATLLELPLDADDSERVRYLEPPQLRGAIFNQVAALIEQQAAFQPLVVFLDDLHWADPTSLELLQAVIPLANRTQLLIIAAFRPRRQEPSWGFHETASRDYHHRYQLISLTPLDQDQAKDLVANLLEVEDLPAEVRQSILDKSEGNPFFVEEIIRSLLDAGLILHQDGHWRATKEIVRIAIPDTLIGVITARIDKLDEDVRHIAQSAAVLGREFEARVLHDVVESDSSLDGFMEDLQRREIIFEKSRIPFRLYSFKHILTQQAAYESILLSNRRELHRRAAISLSEHYPQHPAEIARHWVNARQAVRAIPFLVAAGDQASQSYAITEAIDFYREALALRAADDSSEAIRRAYEGLGNALTFANRIPESVEIYQEMLELGESQGDRAMQISALNKLASMAALYMGQFQQAENYLTTAESLNKAKDDEAGAAESALLRCQMCTVQADFEGVVSHMDELVDIGERAGTKEYIATGLEHIASSLMWLTKFDEAQEQAEKALRLTREIGDRRNEAFLLTSTLPMLAIRNGDLAQAQSLLEEGIRIGVKIGHAAVLVFGNWIAGEIARLKGEYEGALNYGKEALEQALPMEQFSPWMVVPPLGFLGTAYLDISHQFEEQITEFHQHALRLMEMPGGNITGGTAWADLGFCALAIGDLDLAADVFHKGLNYPTMFMYVEKPRLLAGSAQLALVQGNWEEARRLAEEALVFAREKGMRNIYPLTHFTIGRVWASDGNHQLALDSFAKAQDEAERMGMKPFVRQTMLEAAQVLDRAGRKSEAAEKRAEAKRIAQEIAGWINDEDLRAAYIKSTA